MNPPDHPLNVLVAQCVQSHDAELWERLVRRLQPIFARTIYRVASTTSLFHMDEVDDLVQESFLKLKTSLRGSVQHAVFENEPAALAYFRVLAANIARDHFRSRAAEKRGQSQTMSDEYRLAEIASCNGANPDRKLLLDQIDNLLDCDPDSKAIFWLYYRQGFTAREIAAIPHFGLAVKGIESLIRRLTIAVRQKINPQEAEGNLSRETFS